MEDSSITQGRLDQVFDAMLAAGNKAAALSLIDAIPLQLAGIELAGELIDKLAVRCLEDSDIQLRKARIDIASGDLVAAAFRLSRVVMDPCHWMPGADELKAIAPLLASRLAASDARLILEALAFRLPNDSEVQGLLASCYRSLLAENPDELDGVLATAVLTNAKGAELAALAVMLEAKPDDVDIQSRLVQAQIDQKNWAAVLLLCDRVDPQLAVEASLQCAVAATQDGAVAHAACFLERILCLDPFVSFFNPLPVVDESLVQTLINRQSPALADSGDSVTVEADALRGAISKPSAPAGSEMRLRLIALLVHAGLWQEAQTELAGLHPWPTERACILSRLDIALRLRLSQDIDVQAMVQRFRQGGHAMADAALSLLWQAGKRTEVFGIIFGLRDFDISTLSAIKEVIDALAREANRHDANFECDVDLEDEFKANKLLCDLRAVLPGHPSLLAWELESHRRMLPAIMICGLPDSAAQDLANRLALGLSKPLIQASSGLPLDHHLDTGAMTKLKEKRGVMCAPCGATPSNLNEFEENLLSLVVVLGCARDASERAWEERWRRLMVEGAFPVRILGLDSAESKRNTQSAVLAVLDFCGIDRALFETGRAECVRA